MIQSIIYYFYNNIKLSLLYSYLFIYNWYSNLWNLFINIFGPIRFIYLLDNNRLINVTLDYLLGYDSRKNNIYYTKLYQQDDYCHYAFRGNLLDIKPIIISKIENNRKKFQYVVTTLFCFCLIKSLKCHT